ncbi:hypothetical protein ACFB49_30300 [Sphingomonas sp. DBB INV C78]|uniref:hypothetical protein n=1 Tax=Sphingomonas sp. DBB INV C78 TaxID=3349434 RepID=UPI0036D3681C
MSQQPGLSCRAPGCAATVLCKAHIIPAGFARGLSSPGGHNIALRPDRAKPANQPLGAFDTAILCASCDRRLGVYDEYAIKFCGALPMTASTPMGEIFRVADFDGATFARAALAILWRASISARDEWADVSLGPYEARAGEVLLGEFLLGTLPEFEVVLMRYASSNHDARKFVYNPLRIDSGGLDAFIFGLGGFQIIAKIDRQPMHALLRPFVINEATSLRAYCLPLESTAEFADMANIAAAEREREKDRRG